MAKYNARTRDLAKRNARMKKLWEDGYTAQYIAEKFGVTDSRVYQIVNNPNSHLVNA